MSVQRIVTAVGLTLLFYHAGSSFGDDGEPMRPLGRSRAAELLAQADMIADDVSLEISNFRDSAGAVAVDDVRDALEPSSRWRWYWRDHGILLAIPVRERLGWLDRYDGELALTDAVRRVVSRRGWGNPPVQVVFIEPKLPSSNGRIDLGRGTQGFAFGDASFGACCEP